MKKFKVLGIAIVFSLLLSTGITSSISKQKTFGALNNNGSIDQSNITAVQLNQTYEPSYNDIYTFAKGSFGDYAASRLLYRYTSSDSSDTDNIQYTVSPVSKTTSNWCGYYVAPSLGKITGVYGSFNVKQTSGSNVEDANWVGIGGASTENLIQTGVDLTSKRAWIELLPAGPQYKFSVGQNDAIDAAVYYDSSVSKWMIYIQDLTNGQYYSAGYSYSPENTADWIFETVNGCHMGSFGTLKNTYCYYTSSAYSSHGLAINSYNTLHKVSINDDYGETVSPSSIGADGESFSITH